MKNSIKRIIFSAVPAGLFLLLTFTAAPSRAAAPELINFQGKLTDPSGKAVTSAVPMVFKLYTAASGGAAVWQETQNVAPDNNGVYSVLLGTVAPFNISFSTPYWLGVTVGSDGEMLPRYQLAASVYSLYAINSGTAAWAAGADWTAIVNKPSFASGDVTLAANQTFTGNNTFTKPVTVSSDIAVGGLVDGYNISSKGPNWDAAYTHAQAATGAEHGATPANTADMIVRRDPSGNFTAGTITASLAGGASLNVLKAGDTMSGALNMGGGKVTNLAAPTAGTDAANKTYVDGKIPAGILDSTNTFTGQNTFAGTVTVKSDIAVGGLVDGYRISTKGPNWDAAYTHAQAATGAEHGATPANTADMIVRRDPSGNFTAGTITASLAGGASLNVLKAGDTMSGALSMGGGKVTNLAAPTAGTDAANKTYVDSSVGLISGHEIMTSSCLSPCTATCTAGKKVIGGGCRSADVTEFFIASYPDTTASYTCVDWGSGLTIQAYAICAN